MTDHKLTDEEVIRALELHSREYETCLDKCPYAYKRYCGSKMAKDALDLINRQRAEIERLKSMNQAKLDMIHDLRTDLEQAKAEAIKEFAERLKAYGRKNLTDTESMHFGIIITNVLKELTETPCTEGADCSTCEYCYHDGGYNECAVEGVKP